MAATNYRPGGKKGFRPGGKNVLWSVETPNVRVQLRKHPQTGRLMFSVATRRNDVISVRMIYLENADTAALVDTLYSIGHPEDIG